MKQQTEQKVTIPSRVGLLEGRLFIEEGASRMMIALHPHPGHLGTMDNKVVTTVVSLARELGFATLRFNFRGVGSSDGIKHCGDFSYNNETADMDDVWSWLQKEFGDRLQYCLTGFSFGSFIAAQCAVKHNIQHLTLIAPSIQRMPYPQLQKAAIIQGNLDHIVDSSQVVQWAKQWQLLYEVVEAGHFFHGQLFALKHTLRQLWSQLDN